jgi:hypothetical protein
MHKYSTKKGETRDDFLSTARRFAKEVKKKKRRSTFSFDVKLKQESASSTHTPTHSIIDSFFQSFIA